MKCAFCGKDAANTRFAGGRTVCVDCAHAYGVGFVDGVESGATPGCGHYEHT